jgi:hypothetical protein
MIKAHAVPQSIDTHIAACITWATDVKAKVYQRS